MALKTSKEKEGYELTKGFFEYLYNITFTICIVILMYFFIFNTFNIGVDDSDKSGWKRSGLKIHLDAKTGIEYLSDGKGGLIKREVK